MNEPFPDSFRLYQDYCRLRDHANEAMDASLNAPADYALEFDALKKKAAADVAYKHWYAVDVAEMVAMLEGAFGKAARVFEILREVEA